MKAMITESSMHTRYVDIYSMSVRLFILMLLNKMEAPTI